eukprot:1492089-Prymnesium_polylepis.1
MASDLDSLLVRLTRATGSLEQTSRGSIVNEGALKELETTLLAALRNALSSLEGREASIRDQFAFIERREEALRERERKLDEREARLDREREALARERKQLWPSSGHQLPTSGHSKKSATRQADPLDDVPALHESFLSSGGVVPLGVLVAEVEALQQAATRLEAVAISCDKQLAQLQERGRASMTVEEGLYAQTWQTNTAEAQARLVKQKEEARTAAQDLRDRYSNLRDAGVARFVPMLLQTVSKYQAAFDGELDTEGEEAIARVAKLCEPVRAKGRSLRQPLPSALPREHLGTLMQLLGLALHAAPKLERLARDAVVGREGCEEEYEGDYTRIVDLARITIVTESLATLLSVLEWLLAAERSPRFVALRTKDRLSREWDAEMSGGNRDVMVNGWLDLGGGRKLIVEIQLHLHVLYNLKSDLH